MKKTIVLSFTLIGITACSSNKHIVSSNKRMKEGVDTLILQKTAEQPLIDSIKHFSHCSHASHYSHFSGN